MCNFSSLHDDKKVNWKHGETLVVYGHCDKTTNHCEHNEPNPVKYRFMVDDHSTSLTIINLTTLDNGKYACTVCATNEVYSSDTTLTVLSPVKPRAVTIADSGSRVEYPDDSYTLMTAGKQHNVTCTVRGARPPALIEWSTDVEGIQVMDQINVVQGQSYVSRREAIITPSKDDHDKYIRCQASHRKLTKVLQTSIRLFIQVLPRELQLTSSLAITNQTGNKSLVVFENVPVSITCKYVRFRPSGVISWDFGDTRLSDNISNFIIANKMDETLSDAESRLQKVPRRSDHYKILRCLAPAGPWPLSEQVRLVVNGPPDPPEILNTTDLQDGITTSVTCVANNGYPAPVFQWNLGMTDLTNESRTEENTNDNHRVMAQSVLTFTPRKKDHGRYLVCQVHHLATPGGWSRRVRIMINVTYPPTIVDLSVRRSSDDDGNIAVLFSCQVDARPNANSIHWFFNGSILENASDVTINQFDRPRSKTLTTGTLMITNPDELNGGEYVCEAGTLLGNDSDAIIFNLSIPDPPSRLIVHQNQTTSSTLFVAWQPGFDGGFQQTFNLEYCTNDTKANEDECGVVTNLTKSSFRLNGLNPFTWYRLTLWAENSAGNSSTVTIEASTARKLFSSNEINQHLFYRG
nr:nephrin-like [Lytechinus pictus]